MWTFVGGQKKTLSFNIKYTGMGENPSASDSLKDKNIHVSVCGAKACNGDK